MVGAAAAPAAPSGCGSSEPALDTLWTTSLLFSCDLPFAGDARGRGRCHGQRDVGHEATGLANSILSTQTGVSPARWIFTHSPTENTASLMLRKVDSELECLLQAIFSES